MKHLPNFTSKFFEFTKKLHGIPPPGTCVLSIRVIDFEGKFNELTAIKSPGIYC